MQPTSKRGLHRVALIGNHLPRRCGIATFTADVAQSLTGRYADLDCFVLSVNDTDAGYAYPPRVRYQLPQHDLAAYERAADYLNSQQVQVVSLQHEYGIFGGSVGTHVLTLLRGLRMPVVSTLHTVLSQPSAEQRAVLREIAALSTRLVVMSKHGASLLQSVYDVPERQIDLIPHGIPNVPFADSSQFKAGLGVAGKWVLLTFGLLSSGKGIEHVIEALPAITARYPDLVYIVLGATHPHVQRYEGERYRRSLEELARARGVAEQIIFYDHFVSFDALVGFIAAADIYITPYLNREQIVSGTLAYTLGAGKAIISTPYLYAEEVLADGRGRLVPFQDPTAIAEQVLALLENDAEREAMRARAYHFGREMVWTNVAQYYMHSFQRAWQEHSARSAAGAGR